MREGERESQRQSWNLPQGTSNYFVEEREIFIDKLLVRIHFIIVMIRWTGLAPWEFEFTFPGSLIYGLNTKC